MALVPGDQLRTIDGVTANVTYKSNGNGVIPQGGVCVAADFRFLTVPDGKPIALEVKNLRVACPRRGQIRLELCENAETASGIVDAAVIATYSTGGDVFQDLGEQVWRLPGLTPAQIRATAFGVRMTFVPTEGVLGETQTVRFDFVEVRARWQTN